MIINTRFFNHKVQFRIDDAVYLFTNLQLIVICILKLTIKVIMKINKGYYITLHYTNDSTLQDITLKISASTIIN